MQSSNTQDVAFADALARAKEIAARINIAKPTVTAASTSPAVKRPFEDSESDDQPASKKNTIDSELSIDEKLKAIAEQQRSSAAALNAQQVAARINQQLGASPTASVTTVPATLFQMPTGPISTIEHEVPDKMVGLLIGKEGKQITKLQSDTGCKVQIAPDGTGLLTQRRKCTLTGTTPAIQAALKMITDIIDKATISTLPIEAAVVAEGQVVEEMMIAGDKVGLIIGKGGDTIKKIQEETGVKMVMIQDSNIPTIMEKPLRFTGQRDQIQKAKASVVQLLQEKGMFPPPNHPELTPVTQQMVTAAPVASNGPSSPQPDDTIEVVPVPRDLVGIIIGRGGETIRKIGMDYDVRLQFNPDDGVSPDRILAISKQNPTSDLQSAASEVRARVISARQQDAGMGRGRGRGGDGMPDGPNVGNRAQSFQGPPVKQETTLSVPADKCGMVIGKGGIVINEIKAKSGAHVELQRNVSAMDGQKVFNISGLPNEITAAIDMIREKAGIIGGPETNLSMNSPFPPHLQNPQPVQQPGFGQGWGDMNYNQFQQPFAPQGGPQPGQQFGQQPQPDQNKPDSVAYPNYYQQYQMQQPVGMQQFNQPNPSGMQQMGMQQQPQQPQQPVHQHLSTQPMINQATGQPDYSIQWYEYFVSIGNISEANKILQQNPNVAAIIQAKQQQHGGPPSQAMQPQMQPLIQQQVQPPMQQQVPPQMAMAHIPHS